MLTPAGVEALFEGLPQRIALIDHIGNIVKVNKAWSISALQNNADLKKVCEGANYLEVCDRATGPGSEGAAEFAGGLRGVLKGANEHFTMEYPCHAPDEQRWFMAYVSFARENPDYRAIVIHEDITLQKKAEEALLFSEIKFLDLFQNLPVGIYRATSEGQIIDANQALINILGYTDRKSLLSAHVDTLYLDADERQKQLLLLNGQDTLLSNEVRMLRHDGSALWVLDHTRAVYDSEGKFLYVTGVLEDITQRKQQEVELSKLSQVAEQSPGAVVITDRDGKMTYVNQTFVDLTGYSREEALGQSPRILKSGLTSQEEYKKLWETITRGDAWKGEFLNRKKNGDLYWEHTVISPIRDLDGSVFGYLALKEDITELKKAQTGAEEERRFAETLSKFVSVVNRSPVLEEVLGFLLEGIESVISYDAASVMLNDGDITRVAATRGFENWGLADVMSTQAYKVSTTLSLSEMMATQQPIIINDLPEYLKNTPRLQDNLKQFKSYLGVPIRTGNYPIGFIILHRFAADSFEALDATRLEAFANQVATAIQNARLFEELETYTGILVEAVEDRTSELTNIKDRVEAILNNSPDGIIVLGQNGTIETSNPATSHLLRYGTDELFEISLDKLCVEQNTEAIRVALERAKSHGASTRLEVTARRKDGTTFDADLAIAPIAGEGYQGDIVCSLRDITALKEATRMKDAFVSNVSHELRTPITGLKLNHRLLNQDPDNSPIYTERLGREIDRLNILIEDLLRLSRLDQGSVTLNLETIDLNTIAENIANDRRPLAISRDLTLEYQPSKSELYVQVDPGLVGQAISVLVTNALNYTPGGGKIVISTHSYVNGPERWQAVRVSDNGPGVSSEDQAHLFERFYRGRSGRDAGVPGTGLGLAISKEIINLHKGKIEVESEGVLGKGSSFTISIPGIPNEQPE